MSVFAQDKGFRTLEVPYRFQERPDGGESKVNTVSDGIKIMKTIFTLFKEYRPLLFFGTISILLFLLSAIIGLPIFIELIRTKGISSIGFAIVATGLAVFSLIFFSIGMILDSIVKIEQKNFELRKIDFLSKNKN